MDIFLLTLKQMLLMFTLILVGFILRKKKLLPENSGTVMAKMETYIFCPAIYLYSQITSCELRTLTANYSLILYGLIITLVSIIIAYPLARLFIRNKSCSETDMYKRCVYRYAMAFSNFGFMGNFIILGVWGSEMFYKYTLFTFFVSIFCGGWGLYTLIPKDRGESRWRNVKKGVLTPITISMVLGVALGLLNAKVYIPDFVLGALESAGNCQGPVAMVLAGFVIGGYNFKSLIANKKVYVATLLRLIVIPAGLMAILMLIGTSREIMLLALIAFATPLGLNTIVYPAAYGGETETGASMAMISHMLSVVTIPLMYYFFMIWL